MRRPALAVCTAATGIALSACGGPHVMGAAVTISDYAFRPPALRVPVGTRLTFVNRDVTAHTATAPGFDTGTVRPGGRVTVTLSRTGRYAYYCQFHAFMRGTLVVTAP
jgi:plastocyanin